MSAQTPETTPSPRCDNCGRATVKIGKLTQIGPRPLVHVYKCRPCRQIMSIEEIPGNVAGATTLRRGERAGLAVARSPG